MEKVTLIETLIGLAAFASIIVVGMLRTKFAARK